MNKFEILLAWLECNVDCETDIEFTDGVTSADMIPAIQAVIDVLNIEKAKNSEEWREYFHAPLVSSWEMNRTEAALFNETIATIKRNLKDAAK